MQSLYKKDKKGYYPIENFSDLKIGNIVKVISNGKDIIKEGLFIVKIEDNKIHLQSSKSNYLFDTDVSLLVKK